MKGYLLITGTIFAFAGGMHLFALLRGWRLLTADLEFVVENALLCAIGLGLALWAYRLTRAQRRAGG
ncbi:MAG: hypothetical protein JJE40_18645 [Vicinamibacteria bacterium]|nr:hypothetical protein [Vicinamibacteria bacterium]